jgi:hypothetical protein
MALRALAIFLAPLACRFEPVKKKEIKNSTSSATPSSRQETHEAMFVQGESFAGRVISRFGD